MILVNNQQIIDLLLTKILLLVIYPFLAFWRVREPLIWGYFTFWTLFLPFGYKYSGLNERFIEAIFIGFLSGIYLLINLTIKGFL